MRFPLSVKSTRHDDPQRWTDMKAGQNHVHCITKTQDAAAASQPSKTRQRNKPIQPQGTSRKQCLEQRTKEHHHQHKTKFFTYSSCFHACYEDTVT